MIEIILDLAITATFLFTFYVLGGLYELADDGLTKCAIMALTLLIALFIIVSSWILYLDTTPSIESQCKDNSISYTLVQTIAEETGEKEEDVYTVCKYAAAADMDLYELVLLIDPDLTEDEAQHIVLISDLRQKSME
jgi:hypothetical protein